jgi:hypothetical protein
MMLHPPFFVGHYNRSPEQQSHRGCAREACPERLPCRQSKGRLSAQEHATPIDTLRLSSALERDDF